MWPFRAVLAFAVHLPEVVPEIIAGYRPVIGRNRFPKLRIPLSSSDWPLALHPPGGRLIPNLETHRPGKSPTYPPKKADSLASFLSICLRTHFVATIFAAKSGP